MCYILAGAPALEALMTANRLSLDLSELRRQLEEILALVSRDIHHHPTSDHQSSLDRSAQDSDERKISASASQSDELFDKALALLTEFGQASPAILQMWLGIDYEPAVALLNQFEAQGLISSKGRARHKAYELRRSSSRDHIAHIADTLREPVS